MCLETTGEQNRQALKLPAQEGPISSLDSVWVAVNSVLSGAIPNLPDNLT